MGTVVDLIFPAQASRPVRLDHGYPLFAALASRLPWIHEQRGLGVFPLKGRPLSKETLDVSRGSLRIRCGAERIPELVTLVGAEFEIAGVPIRLGAPTVRPLEAAPALSARVVTINGFEDGTGFAAAAGRQLEALGYQGRIMVGRRRIVRIADRKVVGFGVDVTGLSAEGSRELQSAGLGGRRHMGCGLFLPQGPLRSVRVTPVLDQRGVYKS